MSNAYTIARPYAKAIFDTALESNSIEQWTGMLILIDQIAASKKIKNLLSGALSPAHLSLIFIIISGDKINKNAKNLIHLLAENQRLNILNNILKQFLELEMLHKKTTIIKLTSAVLLEKKQANQINKALEHVVSGKMKFIYHVDPDILGGIIIKISNTVFDFSIRDQLKQLSHSLNF